MHRRTFLIAGGIVVAAGPAFAANDDPAAAVREIYRIEIENEKRTDGKGPNPLWPPLRDRLFAQRLARLLAADQKRKESLIDFDPIVEGQDSRLTDLAITLEKREGAKAVVMARFKNMGEAKELEYHMVLERGAWRVADIRALGKDGWLLSRLLTK